MKKLIITLLKVGISLAIIAYLVWNSTRGEGKENAFVNLRNEPKNWWFFAAAWAFMSSSVMLTFIRWWYLARALDIPCRLHDVLRISFWGYLFNFLPLGIVSGDVLKVVMLAREQPRCKTKVAASVMVDRAIGLYLLFVVATAGILLTGYLDISTPAIRDACRAAIVLTGIGGVGIALMFIPAVLDGKLVRWLENLPRVGHVVEHAIDAVRTYRDKPKVLFFSSLMSVGVHGQIAVAVYLIARGLPGYVPPVGLFFVIAPMSMVTQVIPLSLGPMEFVMEKLYTSVPVAASIVIPLGQGLVIALCYRLITVLFAALGIKYYIGNRKEAVEAMHESERGSSVEDSASYSPAPVLHYDIPAKREFCDKNVY
jgi:glycosyltransferase 2 family protein